MYGSLCMISVYGSLDLQSVPSWQGGDSQCLELSQMPFTLDEPTLSGAGASSSSSSSPPTTSSISTDGSVEDLVRSGVSWGDVWDSFSRGELHASGCPPHFLRCGDRGAFGLLEERIVHGWLCKCDRLDHSLAKLNGGSPSHHGGTCSSDQRWTGEWTHNVLTHRRFCEASPRVILHSFSSGKLITVLALAQR